MPKAYLILLYEAKGGTLMTAKYFFHPYSPLFLCSLILVQVAQQKDVLTISGEYIESPRQPMLLKELTDLKAEGKMFCPKCTLGLDIKHTDVLILSQYIRSDGCMLPRRITGLCKVQQKRIGTLVTMAQKSGKKIKRFRDT